MIIALLLIAVLLNVALYAYKLLSRGNFLGFPLLLLTGSATFFVIFPEETGVIANFLGVGRGADLLLYFCFMTGVLLILLVHIKFRLQSIMITDLARSVALSNAKRSKKL